MLFDAAPMDLPPVTAAAFARTFTVLPVVVLPMAEQPPHICVPSLSAVVAPLKIKRE